jgi:hypothetical protein
MILRGILTIFLLCAGLPTYSQLTEEYFSYDFYFNGSVFYDHAVHDNNLILCGKGSDGVLSLTIVCKIDTTGAVIWSTFDTENDYPTSQSISTKILTTNNYIYNTVTIFGTYGHKQVWKINAFSGEILWKTDFNVYNGDNIKELIDYDEDRLLIMYRSYGGDFNMSFIDKNSGDLLSTHYLGDNYNNYGMAIDVDKNIYYNIYDHIFKRSAQNPDSVIWEVQYPDNNYLDFGKVYTDENDSLFLFGVTDANARRPRVIHLNKSDGSIIWASGINIGNVRFNKMLDQGEYFYVNWAHTTTLGSSLFIAKIDKVTGSFDWIVPSFTPVGETTSDNGYAMGVSSMDIDVEGNIFLTGYYGANSFAPANWLNIKLDGNDNTTLYDATVTNDSINYDTESLGQIACVINNHPYFIGRLQNNSNDPSKPGFPTFVKMSNDSAQILIQKTIKTGNQPNSRTIDINNYSESNTLVFKQIGDDCVLEMYNLYKELVWSSNYSRDSVLYGDGLYVNNDLSIILTAHNVRSHNNYPYISSSVDSLYLFILNENLEIDDVISFDPDNNNSKIVELLRDDETGDVFFLYTDNDKLKLRSYSEGQLSEESIVNFNYNLMDAKSKYLFDKNASTLLAFTKIDDQNAVVKIEKENLNSSIIDDVQLFDNINFIMKKDSDNIFLAGKSEDGHDLLMLYDYTELDSVWTKIYTDNSEFFNLIYSSDSVFIYSMGSNANGVSIKKIDAEQGELIWEHVYNGSSSLVKSGIDFTYDDFRKYIIVTGFQADSNENVLNKNVFIQIIDSLGSEVNNYVKNGYINSENAGYCTEVLPDGSIWVGGNLSHSVYGKAGFVFEPNADCGGVWSNIELKSQEDVDDFAFACIFNGVLNGNLIIEGENINNLDGLSNIKNIIGDLKIGNIEGNPQLTDINGLYSLVSVGGDLLIGNCSALSDISKLDSLTSIGGELKLFNNESLNSLSGLDNIESSSITSLSIINNVNLSTCEIQSVCDYILSDNANVQIINNSSGCMNENQVINACNLLGIEDREFEINYSIYPNPTNGIIYISSFQKIESIAIYNPIGQKVIIENTSKNSIDLSDLKSGIYILELKIDKKNIRKKILLNKN